MKKKEKINQNKTPIIGKNIKRMRDEAFMRNVELVTKLQLQGIWISTSTLSKIERGYTNPTVEMLIALTDIFKCDFNAFFQQGQEEE